MQRSVARTLYMTLATGKTIWIRSVYGWGRYRENSSQPLGDVPPEKFGVSFDWTPENGGNKVIDDGARSREGGPTWNIHQH